MRGDSKTLIKEITYKDTWIVRDLVIDDYRAYLLSEEWAELKTRLKLSPKYKKCKACGKKHWLQLHHQTYKWVGTDKERLGIVALCGTCHKATHEYAKKKNISILRATKYIITHTTKVKPKKRKS